jgi:spoIIIJ-associated protein
MNDTIYEGNTLEEALEKAAAALGVEPVMLAHEVTEESDGGFWGLDETYVRLRAWVPSPDEAVTQQEGDGETEGPTAGGDGAKAAALETEAEDEMVEQEAAASTRQANQPDSGAAVAEQASAFWSGSDQQPAAEPAEAGPEAETGTDAEAATPETTAPAEVSEKVSAADRERDERGKSEAEGGEPSGDDDLEGDASEEIDALITKILAGMDFDCTVTVQPEADVYMAMVGGTDKELLLEGNGRPLSALELILNHAFRHRLAKRRKIRVDAGDFRSRREDELRDLAYQVAHSAKETAQTQETQPLNPYERRLVHLALAEDSEVTTRSRGSGFLKNVQVIPRRGGRGNR